MRKVIAIAAIGLTIVACTKESKLSNRLVGNWMVDQLVIGASGSLPFTAPLSDVGSIHFDDDGKGKNNISYSYSFLDQSYEVIEKDSFEWENSNSTVTMSGIASSGEQTIVWDIQDNKKNEQVWTRSDDLGLTYEMTLTKLD